MEYNSDKIKNKINPKDSYSRINHKKPDININLYRNAGNNLLSTNKKSQNQNFTIDSENNKVLFYSEEENKNYHNLANNVRIQNKILELYNKWISTLLTVIDNNKINNEYNDIGTPVQQNLEEIEKLKEENLKIKTKIISQKMNNENLEDILEKKQKLQNMIIKEFNEEDKNKEEKIEKEKEQLVENVQILANELDEINENNKNLNDKIMKDKNLKNIYNLVNLRNQLKQENKLYKKLVVLKNRKNYMDLKESLQNSSDKTIDAKEFRNKKLFLLNKNSNKKYGSLGPISRCGDYKLEKEENIHSNGNIFFCGL